MSSYPPLDPWGSQQQHQPSPQPSHYPRIPACAAPPPAFSGPAAAPSAPPYEHHHHQQPPPSPQQQYQHQHQHPQQHHHQQPAAMAAGYHPPAPGFPAAATAGTYEQQQHHHQHPHAPPPAPLPLPLPTHAGGYQQQRRSEIDARYVLPHAATLVLQEMTHLGGRSSDDFSVTDTRTGAVWFRQAADVFSARGKRVLLDGATGAAVCCMRAKALALKPTWLIYRGGSFDDPRALAACVRAHMFMPASASVYLNDGDDESDYKLRGDFRAKKFVFSRKLPGGGEAEVARVEREGRFASAAAFVAAALTDAQRYNVTVQPGYDVAFVVALALCLDELYNDGK